MGSNKNEKENNIWESVGSFSYGDVAISMCGRIQRS